MTRTLMDAMAESLELKRRLNATKAAFARRERELEAEINRCQREINESAAGLDLDKLALARSVVSIRGSYQAGGQDRAGVITDALEWFTSGQIEGSTHKDLASHYFGTKNYDGWSGQREDAHYGCGPRHGWTVFAVELAPSKRKGGLTGLSVNEREAALYFLINIEAVETAGVIAA